MTLHNTCIQVFNTEGLVTILYGRMTLSKYTKYDNNKYDT